MISTFVLCPVPLVDFFIISFRLIFKQVTTSDTDVFVYLHFSIR